MRKPFEFNSFGELQVKGYIWSGSDTEKSQVVTAPKAVVVIAHGMAETIVRYHDFAEFLVAGGMVVYGYSHRGHFETAGTVERLGYIGEDGWRKMAADLGTVIEMAKIAYPNVPVYVFGHSMGSYVTRTYLVDNPDKIHGIVLSGTGFPAKLELQAASQIAKFERLLKGKDKPSKLMDKMSFGSFNKSFAPNQTGFDWLSTDLKQVQKYIDDPWCGQIHPASFFEDMARNLVRVLYVEPPKPKKQLPMLVMSGALDPVGQMGKGVKQSADFYKKAGYQVDLKLYEKGRHEMLNEVNRQEVFADLLKWFTEHL